MCVLPSGTDVSTSCGPVACVACVVRSPQESRPAAVAQVTAASNVPITAVQFGANRLLGQAYERALGRRADFGGRVAVAMGAGGKLGRGLAGLQCSLGRFGWGQRGGPGLLVLVVSGSDAPWLHVYGCRAGSSSRT